MKFTVRSPMLMPTSSTRCPRLKLAMPCNISIIPLRPMPRGRSGSLGVSKGLAATLAKMPAAVAELKEELG